MEFFGTLVGMCSGVWISTFIINTWFSSIRNHPYEIPIMFSCLVLVLGCGLLGLKIGILIDEWREK